jgi:hypothetical protein
MLDIPAFRSLLISFAFFGMLLSTIQQRAAIADWEFSPCKI